METFHGFPLSLGWSLVSFTWHAKLAGPAIILPVLRVPSTLSIPDSFQKPSLGFQCLRFASVHLSASAALLLCVGSRACPPQSTVRCLRQEALSSSCHALYTCGAGQVHRVSLLNVGMIEWEGYVVSGSAGIRIRNLGFWFFNFHLLFD